MFRVQPLHDSADSYAGARLLVGLYETGVGLREAVLALEPIAETMWTALRESQELDDGDLPIATLSVDSSVSVACHDMGMEGEEEWMCIEIARENRFRILLWCNAVEGGEYIPFEHSEPTVSLEAADVNELATFLTLARTLGAELDVGGHH